MKYRKKPVVIEAMQFDGYESTATDIIKALGDGKSFAMKHRGNDFHGNLIDFSIMTMEGEMSASPGDWIIKGVKGEIYPCKPEIFAATYEPA